MKVVAIVVAISAALLILIPGCSEKEQSPSPEQKSIVRKPIKMPVRKKAEAAAPIRGVKDEPVEKVADVKKTAAIDEKRHEREGEIPIKEEKGYYVAKKGESLSGIAGREDVYGDPLKWPILYRLNRKDLDKMERDENFPERVIPEGTRLQIITPEEAGEMLKKRPQDYWVVNVLSSPKKERVVPSTIGLINSGYPVYITIVKVKGKDWMRVRVGFFNQRKDAEETGKKIIALLNLSDIWTTKADEKEVMEFGGYL